MSDTNFVHQVTILSPEWANDVNDTVYDVLGAAKTKADARTALGLGSVAVQARDNVDLQGGIINNVVIGNSIPAVAAFSSAQVLAPGPTPTDVLNRGLTQALADERSGLLLQTLLPAKGDLLVRGASPIRQPVGDNSTVLVGNSSSDTGVSWATMTMLAEKNPLDDPLNRGVAGDILVRTGTEYTRLPIGVNGEVLQVDPFAPQKVKWGSVLSSIPDFLLEQDVLVIGTTVGAADEGYTFPEGMSFTEFVVKVSQRTLPPSYSNPGLSISGSPPPGNFEVGHIQDIALTESFTLGNAGARTTLSLTREGTAITSSMPFTDVGQQFTLTPFVYVEQASYDQGPCLLDNMGNVDCTGQVPAGTLTSNTITYVGQRKVFYGTPGVVPNSSAAVRALTSAFAAFNNSGVDATGVDEVPAPVGNFVITIPAGAARVVFAYPATLRPVASVRYQELSNAEVKSNFVETSVMVEGANGFAAAAYRVYTYVPVEPFSLVNRYKVFI
jgi:hypothetical protein